MCSFKHKGIVGVWQVNVDSVINPIVGHILQNFGGIYLKTTQPSSSFAIKQTEDNEKKKKTYPTPERSRHRRNVLYPWTKEEKKEKTLLMDREMSSDWRRPIRSASAPHRKAPTIIPKYTIRPAGRAEKNSHV